jgi:hypothetical protein
VAVRLVDIRAGQLETWRNELLEKGVEADRKPIGASTVRKALLVLGIVFRFATRGDGGSPGSVPRSLSA